MLEEYKTKTNKDHNKNQQKIFFGLLVSWPFGPWSLTPWSLLFKDAIKNEMGV